MRKLLFILAASLLSMHMMAEMAPIYYEGFSRCLDDEDTHYGYTGGNDNQWGGDVATAVVIYQDAPEWSFTYCNAGYQCLKVGTSQKQGSATTPTIACEGEAVLTFRVAPWEGDSIFYVSISGATTTDQTMFNLKKHQWTDVTIHLADITSGIRVTFTSTNKHRFFLDDICVRPEDPTVGAIRTVEGNKLDFGLLGRNYRALSLPLHVEGANLTGTYYWVTGYVLGGVKRYNDLDNGDYDGISFTDKRSLVLAAQPNETDEDKYITVQISDNARAALNVVDNPELIGKQIKVQGLLLNDNANPLYLGKPGVRDVRTDAQYVLPTEQTEDIESVNLKSEEIINRKFIRDGQLLIEHNGRVYTITGAEVR